jgi:hypothetical protein
VNLLLVKLYYILSKFIMQWVPKVWNHGNTYVFSSCWAFWKNLGLGYFRFAHIAIYDLGTDGSWYVYRFSKMKTRLNFDIQISDNIDKVKQQIKRTSKVNFWKILKSKHLTKINNQRKLTHYYFLLGSTLIIFKPPNKVSGWIATISFLTLSLSCSIVAAQLK